MQKSLYSPSGIVVHVLLVTLFENYYVRVYRVPKFLVSCGIIISFCKGLRKFWKIWKFLSQADLYHKGINANLGSTKHMQWVSWCTQPQTLPFRTSMCSFPELLGVLAEESSRSSLSHRLPWPKGVASLKVGFPAHRHFPPTDARVQRPAPWLRRGRDG